MGIIRKNKRIILGIVIGILISVTGVYATSVIASSEVSYDNTNSKLEASNVQDALDEIYDKQQNNSYHLDIFERLLNSNVSASNIVRASSSCYQAKAAGSCEAGTIIEYKLNSTEEKLFYVLQDNGDTLTLMDTEVTVSDVAWDESGTTAYGPRTAMEALEEATKQWENVNNITYSMGTQQVEKTGKVRFMTVQEAQKVGCTGVKGSCPKWLTVGNTMSPDRDIYKYHVNIDGYISNGNVTALGQYAAVVEVNK